MFFNGFVLFFNSCKLVYVLSSCFVVVPKGGETMKEISVEWTGSWPCLCHGEWKLIIDGKDMSSILPFQGEDANTHGTYSSWKFDEN